MKTQMELKVRRVGSSLGVLLPKKALDEAGIHEGDTIRLPRLHPAQAEDLYGIWKDHPVQLQGDAE
jgi:hypothetical protein